MDELPDNWTDHQRTVYNRMNRHMLMSQELFTHPEAPTIPDEHWKTICWNAAWMAAHLMESDAPWLLHMDEDDQIIGAEIPDGAAN